LRGEYLQPLKQEDVFAQPRNQSYDVEELSVPFGELTLSEELVPRLDCGPQFPWFTKDRRDEVMVPVVRQDRGGKRTQTGSKFCGLHILKGMTDVIVSDFVHWFSRLRALWVKSKQ
jgi:hypothetical protein